MKCRMTSFKQFEFERMYEIVEKIGLTYDVSTKSRKVPKHYNNSEVLEGLDTT